MEKTGRRLFVYGTLMRTAQGALGAAQRARLQRESRSLGPATMAGAQLYDLGRYPALVESGDDAHVVHGEVLELANAQRTFAWLDAYEDVAPGTPESNEYARLERSVRLACGPELTAWVYVFVKDVAARPLIANGRW